MNKLKILIPFLLVVFLFLIFLNFPFQNQKEFSGSIAPDIEEVIEEKLSEEKKEPENEVPEIIKGVYLTAWTASREASVNRIIEMAQNTDLNAVVIDVKDFSGFILFDTSLEEAQKYHSRYPTIKDLPSLISRLKEEGIYTIARITVFQDPRLALARPDLAVHSKNKISQSGGLLSKNTLWLDRSGLAWIDPSAKESWDYYAKISQEVLDCGFDEINYDYIRFPSDGILADMHFIHWNRIIPRTQIIEDFSRYLRESMPEAKLSVSLFGLTASARNDLGIGQIIESFFPYFNYIMPMVYPSHYAKGFQGFANPAQYPYQVVYHSMTHSLNRLKISGEESAIRPWLQDFNLGAIYDENMIRLQTQATKDALGEDYQGFFLWNSRNSYHFNVFE